MADRIVGDCCGHSCGHRRISITELLYDLEGDRESVGAYCSGCQKIDNDDCYHDGGQIDFRQLILSKPLKYYSFFKYRGKGRLHKFGKILYSIWFYLKPPKQEPLSKKLRLMQLEAKLYLATYSLKKLIKRCKKQLELDQMKDLESRQRKNIEVVTDLLEKLLQKQETERMGIRALLKKISEQELIRIRALDTTKLFREAETIGINCLDADLNLITSSKVEAQILADKALADCATLSSQTDLEQARALGVLQFPVEDIAKVVDSANNHEMNALRERLDDLGSTQEIARGLEKIKN